MDGFFDDLERQMADHNVRGRDQWHQTEITLDAARWCAVRAADQWRKVEEAWREDGRLLDELGRNLHLLLLDE